MNDLTDEQREIVKHRENEGDLFVEACPGAGKTKTIIARAASRISKLPPRRGLALVSFTNSAVAEMLARRGDAGGRRLVEFPSFVGTFDQFVFDFLVQPFGIEYSDQKPVLLDSWARRHAFVNLKGAAAMKGAGIPLDDFDPETGKLDPEKTWDESRRQFMNAHQEALENRACQYKKTLMRRGYVAAGDARVLAARRLGNIDWANALGKALTGRFAEIIVDEAQDCNPSDIKILEWLRSHGIPLVVVCDPDQAIFEFRGSRPNELRQFTATFPKKLQLTGNFRSTGAICELAATLRSRKEPDAATGKNAGSGAQVQILVYSKIDERIGAKFAETLRRLGFGVDRSAILAHQRKHAARAVGVTISDERWGGSPSHVRQIVEAVASFNAKEVSPKAREIALSNIEDLIIEMHLGANTDHSQVTFEAKTGINKRILRRMSLELITNLPPSKLNHSDTTWIEALHAAVKKLGIQFPKGHSEKKFFPFTDGCLDVLAQDNVADTVKYGTIHEAKGRAYEAVCVVLPPELRNRPSAIAHWHTDTDDEARRVIYVGVTRAERMLALAVHSGSVGKIYDILGKHGLAAVTVILDAIVVGPIKARAPKTRGRSNGTEQRTLFDLANLPSLPQTRN